MSRSDGSRGVKLVSSGDRLECAITLEFEPRGDMVLSKATFNNAYFSRPQVNLLLRQIDSLVAAFSDSASSLLDGSEASMSLELLSVFNHDPDLPQISSGLEHAVELQALVAGDALAVTFATAIDDGVITVQSLTYSELNAQANQLAHHIRAQAWQSNDIICICMEKSLALYVSILAVLKLGYGYLPITPVTPSERVKVMMDEAKVTLCLSHSEISSRLSLKTTCVVLELDTIDLTNLPTSNIGTKFDASHAAYAVFTSGSTGVPKALVVTQRNLLSNLACLINLYPIDEGDRLLQACSQAFDVSVFEIFFAWQTGMCACSATNDVLFKDLEMSIRALGITHLSLTPTVAALIDPNNVPNVKFLVTAGEGVTEKVKLAWADRGLFQGYGPSETTNICTVKPNVCAGDLIQNIGFPLKNTSAFVFNPSVDVILPTGALGELCFGGDQVFKGTVNVTEVHHLRS